MRRRMRTAGIILMLLMLSGCGVREPVSEGQLNVAEGQQPESAEDEVEADIASDISDLATDVTSDDIDADDGASQDDTADDADSDDSARETEAGDNDDIIEGNGSYFVRIGTDVYFRTYEPEAIAGTAMDGDFLSIAFAGDDTSELRRFDEKTGQVSEVARDGCTGKLYYCGDRFYYDNVRTVQVWTCTLDGELEPFCHGNVAGVSGNGEYIALWQDIGDDSRSIHVYDVKGDECDFLDTSEFMQVVFCGVTDNGDIIFIGTDINEETGLYSCVVGLPSEILFLGSIPLENIFVDIACDRFDNQGDDVYCRIGYYGGPVLILESFLDAGMNAKEADSMEIIKQGEREDATFDETLYLSHSIFGSHTQRKFLYGDLIYKDDDSRERVLAEDFIPYEESNRLIMQTGEALGDYAYICVAEGEHDPEEDYKVYRYYSYKDMYYLRIPLDGDGEIESIYGSPWESVYTE